MALFGRKKEKEVTEAPKEEVKVDAKTTAKKAVKKETKKAAAPASIVAPRNISSVILRPRITEKAAVVGEQNVYTFEVHQDATKYDVRDAVKELFKVTPVKVNIVKRAPRTYLSRGRGRKISKPGLKKAYVYLKKDDRIDLV